MALPDLSMQVLVSVTDQARHGYAIGADIAARTGTRPGPGSLYGAISRLEGLGLIEGVDDEPRARRYRLTDEGRAVLAQRIVALEKVVRIGRARLGEAWA
jgi:DNA-binding PadR family transcriptional regulator